MAQQLAFERPREGPGTALSARRRRAFGADAPDRDTDSGRSASANSGSTPIAQQSGSAVSPPASVVSASSVAPATALSATGVPFSASTEKSAQLPPANKTLWKLALPNDTLKQGLSVQLEQSPFLELVSENKVNQTLKLMGRPAGDHLTPEVAREVCQRTGSKAMVTGSIAGIGSQFVVGLKAVNCGIGDVLAEAQEQATGKEAVIKSLDDAAVSLRGKLGESLSSVQKYDIPLSNATTTSLEALKAYSLGRKAERAKGDPAALPFFKRAVELDPKFAAAYSDMSFAYSDLNEEPHS